MADRFFVGETELTKLRDEVLTGESAEDWDAIEELKAAILQDDYDKRLAHLDNKVTAPLEFSLTDSNGSKKTWALTVDNLQEAITADPSLALETIVLAYKSSAVKTDQINVLGKTLKNMKTQGATLLANETTICNAKVAGKQNEQNVALDQVNQRTQEVEGLQQQVLGLISDLQAEKNMRSKEFDEHADLTQKFNALKARKMNGETDDSIVSNRGGGSRTKMPMPKDLKDSATSTEYKQWKSSIDLKIDAEEMSLVVQKALIMISVTGEATKNALLILPGTLGKTYSELIKEDLYLVLDTRFMDPFEADNARQSFKTLFMKPY